MWIRYIDGQFNEDWPFVKRYDFVGSVKMRSIRAGRRFTEVDNFTGFT